MRPLAVRQTVLTLIVVGLSACSPAPRDSDLSARVALIGPQGGSIQGPNGAELLVAAGSFEAPTPIALVLPPVGSTPALPSNVIAVGATYDVVPHAIQFSPVTVVSIPFDRTQVPAALTPHLLSATSVLDGQWQAVANGQHVGDGHIRAPVSMAGAFVVVVPVDPSIAR
jgi:hypothetical protein